MKCVSRIMVDVPD